ncbi:hypothetical protein C2W62_11085 [Candidatus Entotheonella serta]|nr:hypothetical protein C2W62_11085 [Candidatus Entotheonella serta]
MFIVGIDVGGTFNDLVLLDETNGTISTAKVPSTPADQSQGLLSGLDVLGVPLDALQIMVHGTTVATNAVLERRGAVCGLLTTTGFRDLLELRRRDRPDTYGLKGQFELLISRDKRLDVTFYSLLMSKRSKPKLESCSTRGLRQWSSATCTPMSTPPMNYAHGRS